jgi:hypothetical protein
MPIACQLAGFSRGVLRFESYDYKNDNVGGHLPFESYDYKNDNVGGHLPSLMSEVLSPFFEEDWRNRLSAAGAGRRHVQASGMQG